MPAVLSGCVGERVGEEGEVKNVLGQEFPQQLLR